MISSDIVEKAVRAMKNRANYEYFFASITSPDWIAPLTQRGFFKDPAQPLLEGTSISFPLWPESRYLAKVAGDAPEEVARTFLAMPEITNLRVQEDVIDAALLMSATQSAELAKTCTAFLDGPYIGSIFGSIIAEKAFELAIKLAREGQASNSLDIFRRILRFRAVEDQERNAGSSRNDVRFKIESYEVERILGNPTRELVQFLGRPILTVLEEAISNYYTLKLGNAAQPEDYSWIGRPAIEDSEGNWHHDPIDVLIDALRDNAILVFEGDRGASVSFIGGLFGRPWTIFHRLAIHLLSVLPLIEATDVVPTLLTKEHFESNSISHEYFKLLSRFFSLLSSNEQKQILDWIEERDMERIKRTLKTVHQREPTDQEVTREADHERLVLLNPISADLPPAWKERFKRYVAEFGANADEEFFSYYSGGFVGPTSPLTLDELLEKSPKEVTDFLRSWVTDSGRFDKPTFEGLGRVLSDAVAQRLEELTEAASLFADLHPTYVRSFLYGVDKALRDTTAASNPNWTQVIGLCEWVIRQPNKDVPELKRLDSDPDWGWTRGQIATLLCTGLSSQSLPEAVLRPRIWTLIETLSSDPNPTIEFEKEYGGSNMEPFTLAANSVRGQAVQAAIRYAIWVRGFSEGSNQPSGSFHDLPEVADLLVQHLDITFEPSLAVRSVYGCFAPSLAWLDAAWFSSHHADIFPSDPSQEEYWRAAWNTYVTFNRPSKTVFEALLAEYTQALGQLTDISDPNSQGPGVLLAEHIFIMAAQGSVSEAKILKERLFSQDVPNVRSRALSSLGHGIYTFLIKGRTIDPSIVESWKSFWQELSLRDQADKHSPEFSSFGWWFASGAFGGEWSLQMLRHAISVSATVQPVHLVLERLADLSADFTEEALLVLRLLVGNADKYMRFLTWEKSIATILRFALSSNDDELQNEARTLIHSLGARGYSQYRSLLRPVIR